MSITPSARSLKNASATKSLNSGPREISRKTESILKLTQYDEKVKQTENKESNRGQTVFSKFRPEINKKQSLGDISTSSKMKINKENSENKEKIKNEVLRGDKVPLPPNLTYQNNDSEHKTIVCWNCESVLLVGDDWDIVQCSNCEKLNKVPYDTPINDKNQLFPHKFDKKVNHFDTNIPYIFVIVICPYCGKQNKVHKGTQHMVCFKCNHSVNIESDTSSGNKINFHTGASTLSSHKPNTIKFSDMMHNSQMTQGIFQNGFQYPNNMVNSPSIGFNYGMDYYFNPFLSAYYGNIYPAPVLQNYMYINPTRNYMLDYYIRNRNERNHPKDENYKNENRYEDKETNNQISKLKENLAKINNDLGIGNNKAAPYKNVMELKDQMENNKSSKNEAIYKSLLMK